MSPRRALRAVRCTLALLVAPGLATAAAAQNAIIVDHNYTKLSAIPQQWIEKAKADLHVAYGHTSHGSQLVSGMAGLYSWKGSLYAFTGHGTPALDLRDTPFSGAQDLGNPNLTAWASATRSYLDAHHEVNVVVWSWCGQVSGATVAQIDQYLSLMSALERDYPGVRFVYMTGHLDGSGSSGNLHQRNEQIRAFCRNNNKILYDFADIESYDPDGLVNYMTLHANDNCDYDSDSNGSLDRNWCTAWQGTHVQNVDWYAVSAAHSQPLNGNLKAYAAWALWARLAGWDGSGAGAGRAQSVYHPFFAVNTLETPYVGDFNGDGRTDIITFTRQNPAAVGDVYVSLSEGTRFGTSTKWHDWFAISTNEQVVIGDYDGDGRDDIGTWLATTTRQVYVALSASTSMQREAVWLPGIGFDATDVLLAGDANGDGRDDLYLFARRQGRVYVALSTGSGFASPALWHGFFAVSTYERPRVADLDGDARDDILALGTNSPTAQGDVYVALSDGVRFVDLAGAANSSSKWHDWFAVRADEEVRVGDLDGDGQEDLFTFLPPPFGQCYTVRSEGTRLAPNVLWPEIVVPDGRDEVFAGDVNGDGRADVIVFAQGEGKVYVSLAR